MGGGEGSQVLLRPPRAWRPGAGPPAAVGESASDGDALLFQEFDKSVQKLLATRIAVYLMTFLIVTVAWAAHTRYGQAGACFWAGSHIFVAGWVCAQQVWPRPGRGSGWQWGCTRR